MLINILECKNVDTSTFWKITARSGRPFLQFLCRGSEELFVAVRNTFAADMMRSGRKHILDIVFVFSAKAADHGILLVHIEKTEHGVNDVMTNNKSVMPGRKK